MFSCAWNQERFPVEWEIGHSGGITNGTVLPTVNLSEKRNNFKRIPPFCFLPKWREYDLTIRLITLMYHATWWDYTVYFPKLPVEIPALDTSRVLFPAGIGFIYLSPVLFCEHRCITTSTPSSMRDTGRDLCRSVRGRRRLTFQTIIMEPSKVIASFF